MKQGLWWLVLCWFCFSAVELLAVEAIHLGPRPFFLVGDMDNGPLKDNTLCHPQTLLLPLGEEHKSFAVSARCYWLNHVGW